MSQPRGATTGGKRIISANPATLSRHPPRAAFPRSQPVVPPMAGPAPSGYATLTIGTTSICPHQPPTAMKSAKKAAKAPTPDFEPIPGSPPKKFPDQPVPLSTQSPKMSPGEDEPSQSASDGEESEDPLVESGLPDNDPEQPRQTDVQKSM